MLFGRLFIKRSKSKPSTLNNKLMLWTGYGLIVMSVFLIAVGVLQYVDNETHWYGH
jgi:hypothetical protein